jgi:putative ABC transport system permease protein
MLSPRWRKLVGDVRSASGRFLMLAVALAVSNLVVAMIFSDYAILRREMPRNYLGSQPASAQFVLDRIDDDLLREVRNQPGIAAAEAAATNSSRIQIGADEWLPLRLFVVPDFVHLQINRFDAESGAWPPATGAMLVERTALPLTRAQLGDGVAVQTQGKRFGRLQIAGTVHDPGLAPAWQEQTVYGYVTPQTLAALGEDATLNLLKVRVTRGAAQSLDDYAQTIETTARDLALWLQRGGRTVQQVRIPPPQTHPHQAPMNAVLIMLMFFALLALLMGAVLAATTISALLAQQVRQIAILQAIGARTRQIAGLYLALVAGIALVGLAIGLPLGLLAGRGFAHVSAQLLNLEIASFAVPWPLLGSIVLLGLGVPLLAVLAPIRQATRRTVREALNDHGVAAGQHGRGRLDHLVARLRLPGIMLSLILRNTLRRRGRLLLTLSLLATAGAMFITSVNLKSAWSDLGIRAAAEQYYDLALRLRETQEQPRVLALVAAVPGVRQVESWNSLTVTVDNPEHIDIAHTYPDGGHGALSLRVAPVPTQFMASTLGQGRWLQAGDRNAVVLNALAQAGSFATVRVGDWIDVRVAGRSLHLQVVGIVDEILTGGTLYVTSAALQGIAGAVEQTNALRVSLDDPAAAAAIAAAITQHLAAAHVDVDFIVTKQMVKAVQGGHLYVLIAVLLLIAVMMAIVGTLGLASMLSTNVIERSREFGVMRAIGARSRDLLAAVCCEALFIAVLGWLVALLLSLPFSWLVTRVLVSIMHLPLRTTLAPQAAGLWLLIAASAAVLASLVPARSAARLTIRETLSYV